jgi:hypothetical protein
MKTSKLTTAVAISVILGMLTVNSWPVDEAAHALKKGAQLDETSTDTVIPGSKSDLYQFEDSLSYSMQTEKDKGTDDKFALEVIGLDIKRILKSVETSNQPIRESLFANRVPFIDFQIASLGYRTTHPDPLPDKTYTDTEFKLIAGYADPKHIFNGEMNIGTDTATNQGTTMSEASFGVDIGVTFDFIQMKNLRARLSYQSTEDQLKNPSSAYEMATSAIGLNVYILHELKPGKMWISGGLDINSITSKISLMSAPKNENKDFGLEGSIYPMKNFGFGISINMNSGEEKGFSGKTFGAHVTYDHSTNYGAKLEFLSFSPSSVFDAANPANPYGNTLKTITMSITCRL